MSERPSLFVELERRNVYRAAVLYAASAWLLVQVATQVFPFFHIAEWVVRWIVIAAIIGFPFWIAFAWLYEFTPEGLKRESEVDPAQSITRHTGKKLDRWIIGILAVAVVLLLTNTFVWHKGAGLADDAAGGAPAAEKSIAVLPFVNMSADPAQDYFSDGIAEELLNRLAQNSELAVAARTSAFQFKGRNEDVAEIARKLHVANVLAGSVRKEGTRVRISAQLIKAASGFNLWSQTFEREATDMFRMQDEIAGAIASTLAAKLGGKPAGVPERDANPPAYDDYLLARSLLARRVGDSLPRSVEAFDRAVARDPTYSPALSGRAFALSLAPGWSGTMSTAEAFPRAIADCEAALRLDPDNAEAFMVRGTIHSVMFEEDAARADLERALALAPGSVDVLNFVGDNYQYTGNLRAAEAMKRRAMALDPLTFIHPSNLAGILSEQGRFPEALEAARRSLAVGGAAFALREMLWPQLRLSDLTAARQTLDVLCANRDGKCLTGRVAFAATADKRALESASVELDAFAASPFGGTVFASDIASVYANFARDMPRANAALRDFAAKPQYNATTVLLQGPSGARLPEEVSDDPAWLAIWTDPRLAQIMAAYRANLAAFRQGR